ncbi:unnamed protein product [marine sediment metagenome]|uniref:Uncharacterized protein n=1 Tax=marine sediment metagenome TaxID=412755 RepID=X1VUL2_9ZZZZ
MIKVIQERDNIYTLQLDVPDIIVLREIATGYGMPLSEMIGSCYNKGIAVYADMICEIAAHETRKRNKDKLFNNTG